ncbi:nucleolar transcription factor 1-A-like [Coccinella septempunctata]|uniref:nucleolar transcription factor 1-A-like n=1 Tax=Coccinella septempunctata TaxID=41139 RepID=UPI001D079993|nr:nucleolar transcription factor 1-A-like [Coccinella septempunctata]
MGSKKNKKVKQEETQVPLEVEDLVKSPKFHKRKRQLENEIINIQDEVDLQSPSLKRKKNAENEVEDIQDEQDLKSLVKPKKKKKKNKSTDITTKASSDEAIPKEVLLTNGITKDEHMKEEVMEIDIEELKVENPDFPPETDDQAIHQEVTMPQNDLLELIRRIGVLLPENDCLSYKCRADKIQWDDVAFSHYSAKECKNTWFLLQKRIRRYRILKEVLDDAKSFVINPPKTKKKLHPEMPRKPPTSYQLYYKKKKPLLISNEPGLEIAEISRQISQMFKNLSPEKKTKYEKQAAQLKAKYEEELQIFYANHPELAESMKKEKLSENKPLRPSTPFMLYFKSQLRKNGNSESKDVNNDNAFKEQCKIQWKQLSMKKKMLWITKAEQDVARYEDEMKEYILKHPNYHHIPVKSILNKEEVALKEKYSGKPDKPPTSAYSLFSKNLLQSDEIKKINFKDRMNHVSSLWKNCTEEEKNKFKAKVDELMEQYKKDYAKYLESLPEDKKQLELQKSAPKKKSKSESSDKKKKAKGKLEKVPEPATPPISAFSYFATSENIDDRKVAKKEWKKLSDEEKNGYEKKLVEIKREYILQFEKFLNSLSKEELEEFSKTKQELKFNSEDFIDDDEDSTSSSEDDSDDE